MAELQDTAVEFSILLVSGSELKTLRTLIQGAGAATHLFAGASAQFLRLRQESALDWIICVSNVMILLSTSATAASLFLIAQMSDPQFQDSRREKSAPSEIQLRYQESSTRLMQQSGMVLGVVFQTLVYMWLVEARSLSIAITCLALPAVAWLCWIS
ncbi:hypothetical protein K438DRAFT_1771632 [Mycena galopus ATCC 62051]|nr:hypothetical protein K438DRAFT_1781835 [Mycena galopus ATCC 62051]KAF8174522.1 hypothetical protein K438DRAFT_1771632 [Mycena galopus ATCC 62051]